MFVAYSKKTKKRRPLPKMSKKLAAERVAARMAAHEITIAAATAANGLPDAAANSNVTKWEQNAQNALVPGWRNSFLTASPGERTASGVPLCRRKKMGPIVHGQPGLPPTASFLEHLHQGTKLHHFWRTRTEPDRGFLRRNRNACNEEAPCTYTVT